MRAFQITGSSGLDSLNEVILPDPVPAPGEVLVRIRAVSLNYRDYMNVHGIKGVTGPIPRIPCSDGAGEVIGVGSGVTSLQVGDRVVCPFMPSWLCGEFSANHAAGALGGAEDGMLRELATLPAASLLRIPEHLDFTAAATLPCAAVTAWNALFVRGQLKPGETVLILGSGGVSVFALQFARMAGARVLAISSSDEKCGRLQELGADAVHNYKTDPAWEQWALRQTEGSGVDKVIEIGGPETLVRSIQATRFGGHISLIGVLTGVSGEIPTVQILRKGIRLDGVYVGSRAIFAEMIKAIRVARLHPVIDSVLQFAETHAAFRRLGSGSHFGKVVVSV